MAGKFSSGKHAIAISDRSGLQYPYTEMVREWNGLWVHISEFESKQPQLELKVRGGDAVALEHPRPPERAAPLLLFYYQPILLKRMRQPLVLFLLIHQVMVEILLQRLGLEERLRWLQGPER